MAHSVVVTVCVSLQHNTDVLCDTRPNWKWGWWAEKNNEKYEYLTKQKQKRKLRFQWKLKLAETN